MFAPAVAFVTLAALAKAQDVIFTGTDFKAT
jgi:hypothetical protein